MGYFDQFIYETEPSFSVIIEDDDKVCYAYLLEEKRIIGDVWLYNNIETPESVDWSNREEIPFANPKIFIKKEISLFNESTFIDVRWGKRNGKIWAEIWTNNILLVRLEEGAFPGWSTLVKKDGPLAKVL